MTANIRCISSNSWGGGSMDFTGSSSNWIFASKTGARMDADDISANIQGAFLWDFSQAKGGSDHNPFLNSAATGSASPVASTAATTACIASSESAGSEAVVLAHGILACIAFVGIFPLGGILIRIIDSKYTVRIHARLQLLGYAFFIAAFVLGVAMAVKFDYLDNGHAKLGIAIFAIMILQPAFGFLHHHLYKKYQRRTAWSHVHVWIGRVAIVLGVINGGTGLKLGHAPVGSNIAYGRVAYSEDEAMITSDRDKKPVKVVEVSQRNMGHILTREL
ncbi:hypothetical protein LTR22_026544 [Elasticomyces elasticus]|nr:hypothetical protein LTR22_026544 [Elasticomyces elasticus]